MTTEAIELICEKLGTTIEKLVPSMIEYSIYKLHMSLLICGAILILGVFTIVLGFTKRALDTEACIVLWILGGIVTAICFIAVAIQLYDLRIWNAYPTMRAYETILSWARSAS